MTIDTWILLGWGGEEDTQPRLKVGGPTCGVCETEIDTVGEHEGAGSGVEDILGRGEHLAGDQLRVDRVPGGGAELGHGDQAWGQQAGDQHWGEEMLSSVSVFSLFHYSICLAFALIVAGTSLYLTCENIVASFVRKILNEQKRKVIRRVMSVISSFGSCPGTQDLLIHTRGVKQEVSFIKCLITSSFLSSVKMGWSSAFCQVSLFITSTSNIILFLFTGL